jgi:hypothetical protein
MTNIYELTARFDRRKSFYGKAHIIETPYTITLQSYDTRILQYNKRTKKIKWLCRDTWAFSATTNRHINEFLTQFTNESKLSKSEILKRIGA